MSTIQSRFRIQYKQFHLDTELEFPDEGVTVVFGRSGSGFTWELTNRVEELQRALQL